MKHRMTKIVAVAALMVGALAACGDDSNSNSASTPGRIDSDTQAIPIPAGSSVEAIKNRGKITIGVKYDVPLFGLKNPTTNRIEGFDVEIGKLIAQEIFGADADGKVDFVEAVSKNREPFIQNGTVDLVISTYTINEARKAVVDFAGPYYVAGQDLLVKKGNTAIAGVESLAGKKVCSVTGSTSLQNVKEKAPQADVSTVFERYSLCVEALKDGRVEAVTTDDIILLGFVADDPNNLKVVGKPFTTEPYGIGLKKGDTALRTFVNEVLEKSYETGAWKSAFEKTVGKSGTAAPSPPSLDRY